MSAAVRLAESIELNLALIDVAPTTKTVSVFSVDGTPKSA